MKQRTSGESEPNNLALVGAPCMEIFKEFTFEAAISFLMLRTVTNVADCMVTRSGSRFMWRGPLNPTTGWFMDFADIKAAFQPIHDQRITAISTTSRVSPIPPVNISRAGSGSGSPHPCRRCQRSSCEKPARPAVSIAENGRDRYL